MQSSPPVAVLESCAACSGALTSPVVMQPDGRWLLPVNTLLFGDGFRCHAAHADCVWLLDLLGVPKNYRR